jgi:cation:H+ antiporter
MFGIDLSAAPIWTNIVIFAAAAAVVWTAGARLVQVANAISDKTGMAQAFAGMLLLGTITTQPEISASITSAAAGNPTLSINNLLGSLAFNLMILVLADAMIRRHALTAVIVGPSILLMGALGMAAMAILGLVITIGDTPIAGVGAGAVLLFAFVLFAFRMVSRYDKRAPWRTDRSVDPDEFSRAYGTPVLGRSRLEAWSLGALAAATAGLAVVVLAAGITLSRAADALAVQTGIGSGFVGLMLLGIATSLPEISTAVHAVRLRRFELVIGEVLGANIFNLGIVFLADIAFSGPPILNAMGGFEIAATFLPLLLTGILMVGLLEQRNRHVLGMGLDSWAMLFVYAGGIGLLYGLAQ